MTSKFASAVCLAAILAASCGSPEQSASAPPVSKGAPKPAGTRIDPGFNLFKPQQDVEIGKQSAEKVESQLPLVQKREVTAFVDRLGKRLAANAPGYRFPYEFHVVDASDLNAFALPGGIVFINRGVLESAKNEGEVAGVLAHEISHVALRHGTHQASKAYLTQAGVGLLGGILGGHVGRGTATMINVLGGFGLNALFLKNSRAAESEADVEGAQILARSGYDPADMISFFQTLEKADKRRTINFLTDHPAPERRIQRIEQEARLLHTTPQAADPQQLQQVKTALGTMPAARPMDQLAQIKEPPASAQRTSKGTIAIPAIETPSHSLQVYSSPDGLFKIAYPINWEVYDRGGKGATFAPKGGMVAIDGSTEIVYGAIVSEYDPISDEAAEKRVQSGPLTAQDAKNDLVAQIQKSGPHLKPIKSGELQPPVGRVLATTLVGDNPRTGMAERVIVLTHQLPDQHLIFLVLVTPESAANRYAGLWDAMMNSLQVNPRRAS
jgi:beta-barrel assembly-enhancing protease